MSAIKSKAVAPAFTWERTMIMKAVGIVVEYNPFHNGHLYHAQMARSIIDADVVIAVMSGSFLQRGEPAIVPKWERTKMALASGVDIVVELPYVYSTQKAELFAHGAMSILAALGVNMINFGSEAGDIAAFEQLVQIMDEHRPRFDQYIKEQLTKGVSFPRAAAEAFKRLDLPPSVLSLDEPNNILGYHYVRAIRDNGYPIKATTTLRRQAHYHDEQVPAASIASATSIRKALMENKELDQLKHVMPNATFLLLRQYLLTNTLLHTWEHYFPLLHYKVISSSPKELRAIYECEEGLEYRVIDTMKRATSFRQWMERLKTKRYTWTRLQRLATHLLTNTTKEEMHEVLDTSSPPYVRLLGMTEQGQAFLNITKKSRTTPLLTKATKAENIFARIEERVTNLYYAPLPAHLRTEQIQEEFRRTPIRPDM